MLQVGYRSNLKSSQSIQDLSRFPEKERRVGAGHPLRNLRPQGIGNDPVGLEALPSDPQPTNYRHPPSSSSHRGAPAQRPRPDSLSLRNLDAPLPYRTPNRKIVSLPQSPVCEELISPTSDMDETRRMAKTRSCSFYIDLNNVAAPPMEEKKQSKSSESILETVQKESDEADGDGDGGSFSSDSLESTSAFGKPPRRCVSDYQIFSAVQDSRTDLERCRSASVAGHRRQDDLFNSQESILSDMSHPDQLDRHSSASFFLRDSRTPCRSSESILTDESDYQFLFQDCPQRQHNRSTESVLTDESDCHGNAGAAYGQGRFTSYEDSGFETGGGLPASAADFHCGVFRTRSLHDTRSSRFSAGRASSPMIHDSLMMDSLEAAPTLAAGSPPLTRSLSLKAKPQSFFIPLDENSKARDIDALKSRRLSQRASAYRPPTAPKPSLKAPTPVVAHKPPKPSKSTTNPRMVLSGSATWTKSRMPAKHIRGIEVKAVGPKETVRTSNNSGQFFERAERATVSPDSSNSDEAKPGLAGETIGSVVKQIADLYGDGKGGATQPRHPGMSNVKMLSKKFERDASLKAKPRPAAKSAVGPGTGTGACRMTSSTSGPLRPAEMDARGSVSASRSEDGLSDLNDDSLAVAGLGWDSGSSTPATSSSCANSPKRLWPPRPPPGHGPAPLPGHAPGMTGRGPGAMAAPPASTQLAKLVALRQQKTLLPSKCPGTRRSALVAIAFLRCFAFVLTSSPVCRLLHECICARVLPCWMAGRAGIDVLFLVRIQVDHSLQTSSRHIHVARAAKSVDILRYRYSLSIPDEPNRASRSLSVQRCSAGCR